MLFSVAADPVLDGRWTVVDETGTVARRSIRLAQHTVPHPAVFRTWTEADLCARRWNARLGAVADLITRA